MTDTISNHAGCTTTDAAQPHQTGYVDAKLEQELRDEIAAWDALSDETWAELNNIEWVKWNEDEALVESGVLDKLLDEATSKEPVSNWRKHLEEL